MLNRQVYIENRKSLADAGEIVIDIRITDPITAMWFEVRNTNGGTSNIYNLIADCVDKVEIIDGSEVICSVTGKQLFVNGVSKLRTIPYQLIGEPPNIVQNMSIPLMFGRWWGDKSFALDPSKYQNPQIRFKWNFGNLNTVGASGFLSGYGTISIYADVMEGAPAPAGVLTLKQHYNFTTGASGTEYIDLPVDLAIKAIQIRSDLTLTGALAGISNLKLQGDQSKVVFFDQTKSDFLRYLTAGHNAYVYKHDFYCKNADVIYTILKQDSMVAFTPLASDTVIGYDDEGRGDFTISMQKAGIAVSSAATVFALVHGFCPFSSVYYECGQYDDPTSWLDPSGFKSLRLELAQNAASALASVVLEQAKPY